MPSRKRAVETVAEPVAKRRSTRQAVAAAASAAAEMASKRETEVSVDAMPSSKTASKKATAKESKPKTPVKDNNVSKRDGEVEDAKSKPASEASNSKSKGPKESRPTRAVSEDPDVDSMPSINPDTPRHDGEWYWLMKAEPETRYENGIDVRFSIDDLRARQKPEGWDGIRAYAARNNMRNMNVGDKAFFYHSNCKEPGIVGIMEIVKEFSEDKSARRPGTPYYDPQSSKENPRWGLVHVEFRKKFAIPITLKALRDLGCPGGPLDKMQMLKQSRLSVTRVSGDEWRALCDIADEKAKEAGLEHVTTKLEK